MLNFLIFLTDISFHISFIHSYFFGRHSWKEDLILSTDISTILNFYDFLQIYLQRLEYLIVFTDISTKPSV